MLYSPDVNPTPTVRRRRIMALLDLQGMDWYETAREGDLSNVSVVLCV